MVKYMVIIVNRCQMFQTLRVEKRKCLPTYARLSTRLSIIPWMVFSLHRLRKRCDYLENTKVLLQAKQDLPVMDEGESVAVEAVGRLSRQQSRHHSHPGQARHRGGHMAQVLHTERRYSNKIFNKRIIVS